MTTEKIEKIWMKVSALNPVRAGLDALNMTVVPFYLFLERADFVDLSHLDNRFGDYETGILGMDDMPAVAAMPGRNIDEAVFRERIETGKVCCGMKHNGKLVAFTWANLSHCHSKMLGLALNADEAYLYDAYTRPSYRGLGIAPYIRWRSYQELLKYGKANLFSYSLYFNTPAVRFKKKLNARIVSLKLHVRLFNRFYFRVPLKTIRRHERCTHL